VNRFQIGDRVWGRGNPFWMTVREALPETTCHPWPSYRCAFGSSEHDAGNWSSLELKPAEVANEADAENDRRRGETA
jgi:hypothetical protein